MIRAFVFQGRTLRYELQRKDVKNINLRIKADGSISVSAHPRVPECVIEEFVESKAEYICRALDRFGAMARKETPLTYSDGDEDTLLGVTVVFRVRQGSKNAIEQIENEIVFTVRDLDDREQRRLMWERWRRERCHQTVRELCERVYPTFAPLGIDYPTVRFRQMRSRWGSCHVQKKILTFNEALIEAPIESIEYVIWHEFVHFLHPDHSSRFYETLASFLPDWKARRERLNQKNG